MLRKLFKALSAVADLAERVDGLEEALADLESRMDTDEAKRIEWVGTVKRVLARINRAEQRDPDDSPRNAQFHAPDNGNDFAEAQRLGLFR